MKRTLALCALLGCTVIVTGYNVSQTPAQKASVQPQAVAAQRSRSKPRWRPATYRGLTLGTSTYADVVRILGDPQLAGPPTDQEEGEPAPSIMYEYEGGGDFPGRLTAWIDERSGILSSISLSPDNLDKAEVIKHFGPDYIITRYDFDLCLGDEESSPIYESPTGSLLRIEYRHLGISVYITDNDKVGEISYVSEPIGAPSSKCKPQRSKSSATRANR